MMSLFKFLIGKSSHDAPVEQSEQRVVNSTLIDKVEALSGELDDLDTELQGLIDRRNELQTQLDGLENTVLAIFGAEGSSFPVFIYPHTGGLPN
jgi:hypothetical protein